MAPTLHLKRILTAPNVSKYTACGRPLRSLSGRLTADVEVFKADGAACKRCATQADIQLPRVAPPPVEIGELPEDAIGQCPVCEADVKLTQKGHNPGRLVHHGYARPGHGNIVGDCYAVGYEPYEVSPKGCIDYRIAVNIQLNHERQNLELLRGNKLTFIEREERQYNESWRLVTVRVEYRVGVTHPDVWQKLLDSAIHNAEIREKHLLSSLKRLDQRIAAWEPKPLRTGAHLAAAKGPTDAEQRKELQKQAGFKCAAKSSSGRRWVVVYKAEDQGIDVGGKRWAIVCTEHSAIGGSTSEADARQVMQSPENFCEDCREAREKARAEAEAQRDSA